jgi:alpha-D-ribose 1-methylphosphonate 5-triphosphate diphosphatase PhnM
MTREAVLSNARLVLGAEILPGSVRIRDGLIDDIAAGASAAGDDLDGDYLLPGVVELHTDHLEYHFAPRPGVQSSPLQAVFQLSADGALSLPEGARLISANPARAVGLDDRGEIAVGKRADLVRVLAHDLPASERHPRGQRVPVIRSVYRQGARIA